MPNRIVDDITENRQDGFAASASLGRGIPRPVEVVLAILVLVVSVPFIVAAAIAVAVTRRFDLSLSGASEQSKPEEPRPSTLGIPLVT